MGRTGERWGWCSFVSIVMVQNLNFMEVHDASRVGGGTEAARVRVWRRPKNSSNITIPNCGHLVSTSI